MPIFEEGYYMEAQDWDEFRAIAMKLGEDVVKMASMETIEFLEEELFTRPARREEFVRDMQKSTHNSLSQCTEWFDSFVDAFSKDDINCQ